MLRSTSSAPFHRPLNGFGRLCALEPGVFDMAAALPNTAEVSPVMAAA